MVVHFFFSFVYSIYNWRHKIIFSNPTLDADLINHDVWDDELDSSNPPHEGSETRYPYGYIPSMYGRMDCET